jgi:hypothetical protein
MKEISTRIWNEPAVFIGFITTLALAIIAVVTGNDWDIATVAGVIAPLASSLGIRSLVTPFHGEYERRVEE